MKISIILPAFNEARLIERTLRRVTEAASAFSALGWEWEIIVCDNNSSDATAELARAGGARVVFEPINQIARARNTGAAAATGDWLIFIDADSSPGRELFSDVAEKIASGGTIAGGTTIVMDERFPLEGPLTLFWNGISRVTKWAAGAFIFCDAVAFRKIGGFDLALFASEEIDLSNRLKAVGRDSGRKFVILHRHPMLTSARKMRLYSRGELLRFFLRAIIQPRRTVTDRQACSPWYDGRR